MAKPTASKRRRKEKKPDYVDGDRMQGCEGCPGMCCHDLVMTILRPQNQAEVDELKWQIQYDTVRLFIVNNRWHLIIDGKCMHLDERGWCRIYEDRPDKCRRHNAPNCERYGEFWDVMIETPDELQAYIDAERERRARRRRRRAKAATRRRK